MYDNDDEFGIDDYRDDVSHIYEMNKIEVKHYVRDQGEDNPTNGDFMGLSSDDSNTTYSGKIFVNINSVNLRQKDVTDSGRDIAGVRLLNGIVLHDSPLNNGDIIEFEKNYFNSDIIAGEKFIVNINDVGALKGQFCFKKFEAYSIGDIKNINDDI